MNIQLDFRRLAPLALAALLTTVAGCGTNDAARACDENLPDQVFGSCPDESIAVGEPGGACDPDPAFNKTSCPDGRCYRDRCWECGGANEMCCQSGDGHCDVGTCANDPGGTKVQVCRTDCGGPGQACCPIGGTSGCQGGYKCVDGMCPGEEVKAACDGSTGYYVMAIIPGSNCLDGVFAVMADSEQDAIVCADATYPGHVWDEVFVQGTNPIETFSFCEVDNPPIPGTNSTPEPINHYSEELALACMAWNHCGGSAGGGCNWEVCS